MLPKKKRITKDLFQTIMKTGRIVQNPLFVCRYIRNDAPHYAFVAPKSIAKRAVERIKMRRNGYNALRNIDILPLAAIFFYKKEAKTATSSQIQEQLQAIFAKISL